MRWTLCRQTKSCTWPIVSTGRVVLMFQKGQKKLVLLNSSLPQASSKAVTQSMLTSWISASDGSTRNIWYKDRHGALWLCKYVHNWNDQQLTANICGGNSTSIRFCWPPIDRSHRNLYIDRKSLETISLITELLKQWSLVSWFSEILEHSRVESGLPDECNE